MRKQGVGDILHKAALTAMIWVLAFQSPLESVWGPFSYIDEAVALIGCCWGVYDIILVRKGRPSKDQLWMGIPLLVFIVVGLTGNLLYQYQPISSVVIDLYTNLKFFFAIGTGYYLFASMEWEEMKQIVRRNSQVITLMLFTLFLADRFFHFWPAQVRYGIPSAMLFYAHPTYLAGAMAFLLALLTAFYDQKNLPCIAMAVIVMAFTLRAKSLASAAIYVLLFVFFLVFHWKLKVWHVIVAGVGSIAIAWDKIRYYFVELSGHSARSVMLQKSFEVMKDHFPIGTGFGTFGSAEAAKHYSPVYIQYQLNLNYELRDITDIETTMRLIQESEYLTNLYQRDPEGALYRNVFLNDHFWPIIFGQSGVLGTVVFLTILAVLVKRCLDVGNVDLHAFVAVLFVMSYLMISSIAEPAFHNAVAVPLAMVLGMVFAKTEDTKSGCFE